MQRFRVMGIYLVVVLIVLGCAVAKVATVRTPLPAPSRVSGSDSSIPRFIPASRELSHAGITSSAAWSGPVERSTSTLIRR